MKYLLLLLFPLTAFANQDNILTWDAPLAVDLPNVQTTQIERKLEACSVSPDIQPWVQVADIPVGTYTHTEVNMAPGDYCYRAFFWNVDTARSGVSNLAFKYVPFSPILNAPVVHPVQ